MDIVWFLDPASGGELVAERDAARGERDRLRRVLDALPLPIWRRRNGSIIGHSLPFPVLARHGQTMSCPRKPAKRPH